MNQPFVDPTKNYILAFNGEIYNYEEIKKLINKGYKFKTNNSDTEILYFLILNGVKNA